MRKTKTGTNKAKTSAWKSVVKSIFISISVTLILLLCIESGAFVLSVVLKHVEQNQNYPYPYDNDYMNAVRHKQQFMIADYCPYIGFCEQKFDAGNYSIVSAGERTTINLCNSSVNNSKENKPINIFLFGGSTTICAEVLDQDTWASQLSAELCKRGYNVNVRNFGESSFVSTQEMIKMLLTLQKGEKPDYVIFFDGYNDFYSAYQNGRIDYPQNAAFDVLSYRAFNQQNFFNPIFLSATLKGVQHLARTKSVVYTDAQILNLSTALKEQYVQTAHEVEALGVVYNFTPLFFWQPTVMTKPNRTAYEEASAQGAYADFARIGEYQNTTTMQESVPEFHDISNILENETEPYYIDQVHVGIRGDTKIAQAIADYVEPLLAK